eukprot:scaffold69284_cov54-Phaeocystis_antarctica.AAC.1
MATLTLTLTRCWRSRRWSRRWPTCVPFSKGLPADATCLPACLPAQGRWSASARRVSCSGSTGAPATGRSCGGGIKAVVAGAEWENRRSAGAAAAAAAVAAAAGRSRSRGPWCYKRADDRDWL